MAETLSLGRVETESTDPGEKPVLLAAVRLDAAVTVSPSLPFLPFCSAEPELAAEALLSCPARGITEEPEPLVQTIPDPTLGPLAATPDAELLEAAVG